MRRLVRRRRDEDGAVAVMAVILSVVIFGVAAIAIDIAPQRRRPHPAIRQRPREHVLPCVHYYEHHRHERGASRPRAPQR